MTARIVIAGVTSGCGKTTMTCAILGALRLRGMRLQPFKAGPDYIDPSYHGQAAGIPARNLDGWLLPPDRLTDLFARAAAQADMAVIEGMMGLYDGRGATEEGSTAQLAKLLRAPVVLVVDVGKISRTAAALVLGIQRFDPALHLAGVILNGIASDGHYAWTAGPIEEATGVPVFGYLPRRDDLALPERHLGLIPTTEGGVGDDFFTRLAEQAVATIDLGRLLAAARSAPDVPTDESDLFPPEPIPVRARIAVAYDEAFSFYYQDNLDLLRAWGAELVPFSPTHDSKLPAGVEGLYVGGGFPELYAHELSANRSMHASLKRAAEAGAAIYAECGGLMYLCEGIVDAAGGRYEMAGIVPGWSAIDRPRLSVGYRTGTALRANFLLGTGEQVRGHEFHWSQLQGGISDDTAAYLLDDDRGAEGFARGSILATYLHVHFGTDPRLAPRFVGACAAAPGRTRPGQGPGAS